MSLETVCDLLLRNKTNLHAMGSFKPLNWEDCNKEAFGTFKQIILFLLSEEVRRQPDAMPALWKIKHRTNFEVFVFGSQSQAMLHVCEKYPQVLEWLFEHSGEATRKQTSVLRFLWGNAFTDPTSCFYKIEIAQATSSSLSTVHYDDVLRETLFATPYFVPFWDTDSLAWLHHMGNIFQRKSHLEHCDFCDWQWTSVVMGKHPHLGLEPRRTSLPSEKCWMLEEREFEKETE